MKRSQSPLLVVHNSLSDTKIQHFTAMILLSWQPEENSKIHIRKSSSRNGRLPVSNWPVQMNQRAVFSCTAAVRLNAPWQWHGCGRFFYTRFKSRTVEQSIKCYITGEWFLLCSSTDAFRRWRVLLLQVTIQGSRRVAAVPVSSFRHCYYGHQSMASLQKWVCVNVCESERGGRIIVFSKFN